MKLDGEKLSLVQELVGGLADFLKNVTKPKGMEVIGGSGGQVVGSE